MSRLSFYKENKNESLIRFNIMLKILKCNKIEKIKLTAEHKKCLTLSESASCLAAS